MLCFLGATCLVPITILQLWACLPTLQHCGRLLDPVPNHPWVLRITSDPLRRLIVGSFRHNCTIPCLVVTIRCRQQRFLIIHSQIRHTFADACLVLRPCAKLFQQLHPRLFAVRGSEAIQIQYESRFTKRNCVAFYVDVC